MNPQLQQLLVQYAQAKGMDEQQTVQFMQEFIQAKPQEQQAFIAQIQQQNQQPEPQTEQLQMQQGGLNWSRTGYKSDSPHKNRKYNVIPSNSITMKGVDQPLMLYGDGGEVLMAQPGGEYHLPNSSSVLEIPMQQQGGKTKKGKLKAKPAAKPVYDYNRLLPDTDGNLEEIPVMVPGKPNLSISQDSLEREAEFVPQPENPNYVPIPGKPYRATGPVPVNPFKPEAYQFLPDILKYIDASSREPGYLPHQDYKPLHLDRLNPTAAKAELMGAYRGANQGIVDSHTQIGRGQQMQQYSNFLNALNSLNGQYDTQNTNISNSEAQYNNQMERQVDQANLGYNEQFYQQSLGTSEAQREAKFSALDSMTTKMATAKQQQRNYELFKSTYSPKFIVGPDGEMIYDTNSPDVKFSGTGRLSPATDVPAKSKLKTTRNADGTIKQSELTEEQVSQYLLQNPSILKKLNIKQQGGLANRSKSRYTL